jgi:two-component system, chemotaxis family, sensor kinase CheA
MQVERQTILALNQTRNQLSSLKSDDKETIIHAGAGIESVYEEIPADYANVQNALMLCLQALQAIYQDEVFDFEQMLKALLGVLIGSEQSLGSPPNPISELMLGQAVSGLQAQLDSLIQDDSESIETAPEEVEEIAEETPPEVPPEVAETPEAAVFTVKLDSLDDVAASLMQLELSDAPGLDAVCEALKTISTAEADKEKRKLIVKAARELTRIVTGKTDDAQGTFNLVGELIDQANNFETKPAQAAPVQEAAPVAVQPPPRPVEVSAPPSAERKPTAKEAAEEFESDILPVDSDASLVSEFVIESYELLEAAEIALLALETEPENIENVNTVFRAFHTVKGSGAYLGLKRLAEFAHHAESLLSRMRDREIQCSGGYANLALRSLDILKEMLTAVEQSSVGKPMHLPAAYGELVTVLKNPEAYGVNGETDAQTSAVEVKKIDSEGYRESDEDALRIGEILVASGRISEKQMEAVIAKKGDKLLGQALVDEGLASWDDITEALITQNRKNTMKTASDSSVRVRTDRLDSLIDMVGELVIAQSMLAQDSTVIQGIHHELARKISHAGKIVRELQDLSMGMRMIPLKNTFQKMARLVRDVSKKCGKQVEFVTDGEDTEIDRNMVDFIADPLVHMVRNAVDHGIEKPDNRKANGKSAVGKVKLAAYHAGGDVVVELTDDGAGLDPEKLVAKAIAKNLIESDKGMSENEIFRLIFAPGFSTADTITDVSGRGVGMDVVRRNIEAMRGRIEISSEKGRGSVFTIRLPLTLAITDGMLVRVGSERYIVPTVNIQLSFQPNQKMLSSVAGRGELVSLRGELMPVFRLHELFDVKGALEDPTEGLLMIVADGRRRCALLVDELLGQQQVVTKTLGQGVGKIPGVSGGAILGDGCVGLILDTAEIVALARQNATSRDRKDDLKDDSLKLQAA